MKTKHLIESLLFMTGKPVSIKKLSETLGKDKSEVTHAADELMEDYARESRGMLIQKTATSYQMATSPEASALIREFIKSEQSGELTKPSLETLTIIAYRGPITKAELEQIRGVNCSLILRNLLIKGLIETRENRQKMATEYSITFDFLRFLGLQKVEDLPDYEKLNQDENLKKLFDQEEGAGSGDTAASDGSADIPSRPEGGGESPDNETPNEPQQEQTGDKAEEDAKEADKE